MYMYVGPSAILNKLIFFGEMRVSRPYPLTPKRVYFNSTTESGFTSRDGSLNFFRM